MENTVELENRKENKMSYMSIKKLVISMSLPMMISMLVMALYNIVDSMFIAMINENALTALSLAFPFQNLMIAFGTGTGVGINAFLSKSLGEKEFDTANNVAKHALLLAVCTYMVFLILGISVSRFYFSTLTDIKQIIDYGTIYLTICCIFSIGMFMQMTLEKLLQSTGKTFYSMISQIVGAIINIIFDPILIFGLFGMPKLGVAGAALATIFGQCVACGLALYFNINYNKEINLNLKDFKFNPSIVGKIYSVGVPSIIMASISSIMNFGMNKILIGFTSTAVAVFGVYYKLQSFVFMPVFGLNNGIVPIISYNYGARHKDRITATIKFSIMCAVSIMAVGTLMFLIVPDKLLMIFSASDTMLKIGVPALRIIALHFVLAGVSIPIISSCQALGHGFASLAVSVVRQLVVLLPSAFVLSRLLGLTATWTSFIWAEFVGISMCVFYIYRIYHNELKNL